jgi:spermidine synthase
VATPTARHRTRSSICPAAQRDAAFPLVIACFALSGFAALLYQTVWTRQFAFVFGTSELAVATVLAAYMGGLSAGAALAGRLAPRIRRPILVYGLFELGIGAAALAVPLAISASNRLAVAIFGGASEPPDVAGLALPAFYLASSFVILMAPTFLMGATLPLLARHAVRSEHELGRRVALLYAANTGGAVLGTLGAAFALLPAFGLRATVVIGAGMNGVVFLLAALVARRAPLLAPATDEGMRTIQPTASRSGSVLPLMLVSGAVSFVYEVLWTRLLGHVLGGSVHAFATMLATFLLGIALGSAIASRWARARDTAARGFAAAQIGIALASVLAYAAVNRLPEAAQSLGASAQGGLAAGALLAGAVLLPSTLFIGATFPLAVRVLARDASEAGTATARVYAWNTLGAIVGAVGGGFVLIPALGYADTVFLCAASGLVLALTASLVLVGGTRRVAAFASLLLLTLVLVRPGEPSTLLRTSPLKLKPQPGELTFVAVGRTATVVLIDTGGRWLLRTNGLPESGIPVAGSDSNEQLPSRWMGGIPTVARPGLESLLFVGFGGGRQLEGVAPSVQRIDVIELEPEVIAANRVVADRRAPDPLSDPRLRIHLNDARGALLLTERRWDAIVSQPSHPWTAGAAHLYTREFFELVREHLTPGGVFVQWIGLRFVDQPLLRTLLATLTDVFPHVRVLRPGTGAAWLFVASAAPLPLEASLARAQPIDEAHLGTLGLDRPEDLAAQTALDEQGAWAFGEGAPLNTDDRNLLQMHAPRALRNPVDMYALDSALASLDPLVPLRGLDPLIVVRKLLDTNQLARAARVARSLEETTTRRIALALVEARKDRRTADATLRAILEDEPQAVEARKALALLLASRIVAGDPAARTLASALEPPARAVIEGWRWSGENAWERVRVLDSELAQVPPDDTLYTPAVQLRMRWRIESGDPAQAKAAVALGDQLLVRARQPQQRLLRAWALAVSGAAEPALADLEQLAVQVRNAPALVAGLRRAVSSLPRTGALAARRTRLEQRLQRLENTPPPPRS